MVRAKNPLTQSKMKDHLITIGLIVVGVLVAHFIASKIPFLNTYESYESYPVQ